MKYLTIILLFYILILPSLSFSGIWEPNPNKIYRLDVTSYDEYKLLESNEKWVLSLVNNLKAQGGKIATHHIFVRTSAPFQIGSDEKGIVFVNRSNKNQFITFDRIFLIDFDDSKVSVFGCGGATIHKGPKNNFIVVIDPYGIKLSGIPVSTGGIPPKFNGNVVSWY